jgi:FAD/FMN-containing dehydrogenase
MVLDMRGLNRVVDLDTDAGILEVEAGIEWPDLIRGYFVLQHDRAGQWGIRQKQTGADRLSIGGAVAANIHGRGLSMRPFVEDVVALDVIDAEGRRLRCSRRENAELFRHVVGGYGLFAVVVAATLRLTKRRKVQRVVELATLDELAEGFASRIANGYLYGDFQFGIDPSSPDFLHRGVFSCYLPVADDTPVSRGQRRLSKRDWSELLVLAHVDKTRAFDAFSSFYLASNGQVYWSDTHQLSIYLDDYHRRLDLLLGAKVPGTEMIMELYVPLEHLTSFLADVAEDFCRHQVDLIDGTIRLVEREDETALPWARQRSACVIFNLHTDHCESGIGHTAAALCRLIDIARSYDGSYFLTYHRYATREQVLSCHPGMLAFLAAKRRFDPEERLQSDWYRHHVALLDVSAPTSWTTV